MRFRSKYAEVLQTICCKFSAKVALIHGGGFQAVPGGAVQDDARAVQAAPSRHSGARPAVERGRNPAFTMMGEFRRAAWRRIVNAPASDADHREP